MHGRGQYGPHGAAIVAHGGPGRKKGPFGPFRGIANRRYEIVKSRRGCLLSSARYLLPY